MRQPAPTLSRLSAPGWRDWALLAALIFIGGSAFSVIKVAVQVVDPVLVSAGRLWVAALVLLAYAYGTGHPLPPLLTRKPGLTKETGPWRIDRRWLFMGAGGVIGYAIPFTLFPIAQQTLDSLLAGIYMAFMPLMTIIMAYFFAGEALSARKLGGFAMGTVGVIFLIGPSALGALGQNDAGAQGLLLVAVTCYAIYAVLTRRAPQMQARTLAAGTLLCSALAATPLALFAGQSLSAIPAHGWWAVLYLGLGPAGLAAIMIVILIRRVGAGFMAMGNYVTPVVAIVFGMVLFAEPLKPTFLIGLGAILAGLALSQSRPRSGPETQNLKR